MCSSKSLIIKVSSEFPPTLWGRGPTTLFRTRRPGCSGRARCKTRPAPVESSRQVPADRPCGALFPGPR